MAEAWKPKLPKDVDSKGMPTGPVGRDARIFDPPGKSSSPSSQSDPRNEWPARGGPYIKTTPTGPGGGQRPLTLNEAIEQERHERNVILGRAAQADLWEQKKAREREVRTLAVPVTVPIITHSVVTEMYAHARETYPDACVGVNPTLLSLGAIRRKDRQMKELSEDLLHPRNALKPCIWLSHALSDPKMKENWQ